MDPVAFTFLFTTGVPGLVFSPAQWRSSQVHVPLRGVHGSIVGTLLCTRHWAEESPGLAIVAVVGASRRR